MIDHLSGMRWAPGGHLRVKGREEREKKGGKKGGGCGDRLVHSFKEVCIILTCPYEYCGKSSGKHIIRKQYEK